MCKRCPGVDCAHDRETDTWPPPPPLAPALPRDGGEPVDLLAALGRSIEKARASRLDGGER